ncbi:MAG: hypothetical protein R3F60_34120 [bacterium]
MLRLCTALLVVAGLCACDSNSSSGGHRLRNAAVQAGAGVSVDEQHTLHGGAGSAAVISTTPNGRLTAVIVD